MLAVLVEVVLDLGRQLAGRLEDQGARHARPGAAGLQHGQHRQGEGRRLAGAGLGDAQHVAARENVGDGLGLDRRRLGISGACDGLLNFIAKSEFGERHEC